jgi:hypothetical protein
MATDHKLKSNVASSGRSSASQRNEQQSQGAPSQRQPGQAEQRNGNQHQQIEGNVDGEEVTGSVDD